MKQSKQLLDRIKKKFFVDDNLIFNLDVIRSCKHEGAKKDYQKLINDLKKILNKDLHNEINRPIEFVDRLMESEDFLRLTFYRIYDALGYDDNLENFNKYLDSNIKDEKDGK